MALDFMGFEQRKRAATGAYGAKAAQNAYAQFLSQQRGARKTFDVKQQYERQAPKVVSSFTKRGLAGPGVMSGVYETGLQRFGEQNIRDLGDIANMQDEEMNRLKFEDAQARAEYDQQIADLEAEKQAAIAQAAATLSAFKPFLGG